jgi:SAM-dependent methyltransferase
MMRTDVSADGKIAAPGAGLPWRRMTWIAGATAAAASGGFLVYGLVSQWADIAPLLRHTSFALLVASVVAYFVSAVAAALVWHGWLEVLGTSMSRSLATSIALTSQIAKYIPGNFAHHLGKAALARQAGVTLPRIAASIAGELLSAPVLAVATLALVLLLDPGAFSRFVPLDGAAIPLRVAGAAVLAAIVLAAAFSPMLVRMAVRRSALELRDLPHGLGIWIVVTGCVMFAAAGASFHAVAMALEPDSHVDLGFSIAIFTLAWTAGFLTPGAPAGLGVREVLIVAALALEVGAPTAMGVALLHRMVTGIGDLVAFALGCYLRVWRTETGVGREDAADVWRGHAIRDPASRVNKARKIEAILEPRTDLKAAVVLELGAGAGHIAHYFAGRARHVVAADRDANLAPGLGLEFVHTPDTALPFADGSFDVVIYNHVIEHVGERPAQRRHLREIARVLRPGGLLYLAVPNRWSVMEPHYRLPFLSWLPPRVASRYLHAVRGEPLYDCRPLARGELRSLLEDSGFAVEDVTMEALQHFLDHETDDRSFLRMVRPFARPLAAILSPVIPTLVVVGQRPPVAADL